jgi:hypothetical protein
MAFNSGDFRIQIRGFRRDVAYGRFQPLQRRVNSINLYFYLTEFGFKRRDAKLEHGILRATATFGTASVEWLLGEVI